MTDVYLAIFQNSIFFLYLNDFNFQNYMSILCIIAYIIFVGLDNNMLSHLMGSLCDGVTTYNIGMWLYVKY